MYNVQIFERSTYSTRNSGNIELRRYDFSFGQKQLFEKDFKM